MSSARLQRALAAIDAVNAGDPHRLRVAGVERPKEIAHAEMVGDWVRRLRPEASEALLLAARAHHIRRWAIPRSSYAEGRAGYFAWRRALHDLHAAEAARILEVEGYDAAVVLRVQNIIRKHNLVNDPEVQTLEDALCLVFLETQFHDLAGRLESGKMIEVVRKTLRKMTAAGREQALRMEITPDDRVLIEQALAGMR